MSKFFDFLGKYFRGEYRPEYRHHVVEPQKKANDYSNYINNWKPEDGLPLAPNRSGMHDGAYEANYNLYKRAIDQFNLYQKDIDYERQKKDNWDIMLHEEEYNSIGHQLEEFEKHGLSKNLIYGSGNGGFIASSGGAVPSMDAYQVDAADPQAKPENKALTGLNTLLSLAGMAQNVMSGKLNLDLAAEAIKGKRIGNTIAGIQAEILGKKASRLDKDFEYEDQYRSQNLETMKLNFDKIKADFEDAKSERELKATFRKYGLNPNDPWIARSLAMAAEDPEYLQDFINAISAIIANTGAALRGVFMPSTFGLPGMDNPDN